MAEDDFEDLDGGLDSFEDPRDADDGSEPGEPKKNYITRFGLQKLKDEYQKLFHDERPKLVEVVAWAASNGDRSENGDYIYGKKRLREIDRRLKFLGRRMEAAVIVNVADQPKDKVLFGAKVTIQDENDKTFTYWIVGEDEIDMEKRRISWVSPMAKALLNAKLGDTVLVQRPSGEMEMTILKIEYNEEELR